MQIDDYSGRIYSKCEILETKGRRGYGGANTVILCRCRCLVCRREYWITAGQVDSGRHNGCGLHRTKEISIDHDVSDDPYMDLLYGVFQQAMQDLDNAIRCPKKMAHKTIEDVHEYVLSIKDQKFIDIMEKVEDNAKADLVFTKKIF